ncbi:hypothetical protein H6F89_27125 [Cyanobacteria bacterium FACHB-63]|nr:hypothetical protein [Cyanobacteria bacterium FACHB-63]
MQEQQQELSADQKLQSAIEQYARIAVESQYLRHAGNPERFTEFYEQNIAPSHVELTSDNQLQINGKNPDFFIGAVRRNPKIEESYFGYRSKQSENDSQAHPAPDQQKPSTATKTQKQPDCLYVSRQQLMSREFMLAAGPELSKGIQSGRIKVDGELAVQSGHEIRTFLEPKPEPQAEAKAASKPATKTTQVSKAQLLDRNFLRKVDAEWQSEGGYLAAVSKGLIKIS